MFLFPLVAMAGNRNEGKDGRELWKKKRWREEKGWERRKQSKKEKQYGQMPLLEAKHPSFISLLKMNKN